MEIKSVVENLCSRYGTRDPLDIIGQKRIVVLYEPLGAIRGFYSRNFRQQFIHINEDIPEVERRFVAAHELGHAVLHPQANTPFLREKTLFSVNRLEVEANRFAAALLYSDEDLLPFMDFTSEQTATALGLPCPLTEWRLEQLHTPI